MVLTEDSLQEVTVTVCEALLWSVVEPDAGAFACDPADAAINARVEISGAWQGTIELRCSYAFARTAAGKMFGKDVGCTTEDDIRDSIGELTNVIGGNLKALLPETCQLSLPVIAGSAGCHQIGDEQRLLSRIGIQCDGELLTLSVLEHI